MPSNLVILTGIPSNLWLHGWSTFDLQPQRCQPPRYRCFQQCMQFFENYKMISRTFFMNFPAWCHQRSNSASQMHITSLATTTTNLMHLSSTHGLHIHVFLPDCFISNFLLLSVLDPQISYEGMKVDYTDNPILSDHLEESKSDLFDYFNANYTNTNPVPPSPLPSTQVQSTSIAPGLPQKSFTARYCRKEKTSINELEEYFKHPMKDFEACNPIHW